MNLTINWLATLPLAIVLGAGVISTLLEAFLPRSLRRISQTVLSLVALASAFVAVIWRWHDLSAQQTPGMLRPLSYSEGAAFSGFPLLKTVFRLWDRQ